LKSKTAWERGLILFTYVEALKAILSNIQPLEIEEKVLIKAAGQVLAEDVYADYDLPRHDISGPDGYAVIAKNIEMADKDNPATLQIIDTVRAGCMSRKAVTPGTAIRIMTGSDVPDGADCVVRFEDTDEPENKNGPNPDNPTSVKIYVNLASGTNIHKTGANIKGGDLLIPKTTVIGPPQLSSLAAIGRSSIKVIRRPKVAIITTGDELVRVGSPLPPGKKHNSNEVALRSLVSHNGGLPWVLGIARDDERSITYKMQKGLDADAIITTGGVSKGDYDLTRQVIGKMGKLLFSRINLAPGAAFAFGLAAKSPANVVPIFAISGPPPGCIVNFETLVRPALLKMRGLQKLSHPKIKAILKESVNNAGLRDTVRWTDLQRMEKGYQVKEHESSSMLAHLSTANSFIIAPAKTEIKAGEKITVWPLDWANAK
jgi:molybdopterin molybdotransferase